MKSLVCTVLIATSLAISGNAAMAARVTTHKTPARAAVTHRTTSHRSVAGARFRVGHSRMAVRTLRRGRTYGWFDIGRFIQAMLGGGPIPYATIVHGAPSYSAGESPTYDNSPVVSGADDTAQQVVDEANEINMEDSMQAAQEQNDEANAETNAGIAAAEQTEINSGM